MTKLKPCPFCDGEASAGWFAMEFNIDCPTCKIAISHHAIKFNDDALVTKAACITAWNARSLSAAIDVVLEMLYWRKTVLEDLFESTNTRLDTRARAMGVSPSNGERLVAMLEALKLAADMNPAERK